MVENSPFPDPGLILLLLAPVPMPVKMAWLLLWA